MRGAMTIATVIGLVAVASGDPKRSTPPPPPPVPTTPTAPPVPDKPKEVWDGNCLGAIVFLDNPSWRQCCLLCSVGDDFPSAAEKAAAERDHEKIVVTNYFSIGGVGTPARRDGGGDDAVASSERKGKHEEHSMRHTWRDGLKSTPSLIGRDLR